MSNDWFDELLKDVNLRSKEKREVNNDVAKDVKIRIKNLDLNNVIVIVTYNHNNGTKTLTLHPQQRLPDFLTQVTTKRDIDVLKYVVKTLKAYVDMNNVLKELTTFDLDDFYENNVKKRRIKLTNVNLNVNNVIKQTTLIIMMSRTTLMKTTMMNNRITTLLDNKTTMSRTTTTNNYYNNYAA